MNQKNSVLCKVQDFGTGMSEEAISNVFNPEIYHPDSSELNHESIGLGLKLSKEFVESNNGKIWIENGPDRGIVVQFTIMK